MTYTKGPWYPVQYANYWNIQKGKYYEDENLLDEDQNPNAEANARLAAAAPDLLEALIEVIRISDRKHDAWDKAKTVIEKATKTYN